VKNAILISARSTTLSPQKIKGWLVCGGTISLCKFLSSGQGIAKLLGSKDGWYETGKADECNLVLMLPDHSKGLIVGVDWTSGTGKFVDTTWTKEQVRKFVCWVPQGEAADAN
jgi:hypothetical protein